MLRLTLPDRGVGLSDLAASLQDQGINRETLLVSEDASASLRRTRASMFAAFAQISTLRPVKGRRGQTDTSHDGQKAEDDKGIVIVLVKM